MPAGPGQGNGSGGAKGIKGAVASADFGNGIATGGKGDGRSNGTGISTGGFGSEQVVHGGPKIAQADGPATTPVEITFKPNPLYTDEARSLKLEGEVLLEVMFGANGTLHVNRVVRVWVTDWMRPRSRPPTRCASSQRYTWDSRWIQRRSCTCFFRSRTKSARVRETLGQ